jgi:carbamoyl-phosphate synthase large subunit
MRIVFGKESLKQYIGDALEVSESRPVLMDRFLSNAVEVDVDAISDGTTTLIGGIMEHIEEAGIHSGDSACSLPPFTLGPEVISRLREQTRVLAARLKVIGLLNIQFAVKGSEIFVLEVNPRASRTIPFVSKAVGAPLAKLAARLMLGRTLKELGHTTDFDLKLSNYNVKMPVFPFHKFPGVDVLLGPEMKSTGEVMGRADNFPAAYAKALMGAGITVPKKGRALLSIADTDKAGIVEIAAKLIALGFSLEATSGTHEFLKQYNIPTDRVAKFGKGSPDCVSQIAAGRYQLVINTSSDERAILDSYSLRRMALEKRVPYCTLLTMARAFIKAIAVLQSHALTLSPLKPDGPLRPDFPGKTKGAVSAGLP